MTNAVESFTESHLLITRDHYPCNSKTDYNLIALFRQAAMSKSVFKGTVHGKVIELDQPSDLPDGQQVTVVVQPTNGSNLPAGEGLRRSAGSWAEEADELDKYLEWNRQQRKGQRRELGP
jgi:hypothetical protein